MNDLMECDVVSVRKMDGEGNLKAFVDIRVGGSLIIRGCTVMEGKRGTFASMPRKIARDGQWRDIIIASDDQLRSLYEQKILDAYASEDSGNGQRESA